MGGEQCCMCCACLKSFLDGCMLHVVLRTIFTHFFMTQFPIECLGIDRQSWLAPCNATRNSLKDRFVHFLLAIHPKCIPSHSIQSHAMSVPTILSMETIYYGQCNASRHHQLIHRASGTEITPSEISCKNFNYLCRFDSFA